jgi:hypothetical protein
MKALSVNYLFRSDTYTEVGTIILFVNKVVKFELIKICAYKLKVSESLSSEFIGLSLL